MEIRRKSWHYWFYTLGHPSYISDTTNLCSYFWRTVFGMLLAVIGCTLAILFVGAMGFVLYLSGHILVVAFQNYPSFTFAVLGVAALISLFIYKRQKPLGKRSAPRPPGLLRSYLRAKKDKVCPLVTFRDDPETQPGEMPEGC